MVGLLGLVNLGFWCEWVPETDWQSKVVLYCHAMRVIALADLGSFQPWWPWTSSYTVSKTMTRRSPHDLAARLQWRRWLNDARLDQRERAGSRTSKLFEDYFYVSNNS